MKPLAFGLALAMAFALPVDVAYSRGFGEAALGGEGREAQATKAAEEVRAGYRIAKFVCRVCHIVEAAQTLKPILEHPGPSFMDIANRPGVTVDSLKNFISTTDWDLRSRPIKMANKGLSDRSTEEVARYIISLKGAATIAAADPSR